MTEAYSLYQVNEFLKRTIALNFPNDIWIRAEISQIRESRGHWYLELVEKAEGQDLIIAQSSAAIWRNTYGQLLHKVGTELKGILADGMEVMVKAKVTYHERYGLKLNITDVQAEYTLGRLAKDRAAAIEKLRKLKLMDLNKMIPAPLVLQKIAVISSATAAGFQDFQKQLEENAMGYAFNIDLFPAAMQGMNTEPEVLHQLKMIAAKKRYDVVVIIRGGGAKLDLVAFDSFEISSAVAKYKLPVLVGIGHDIDESILDMVAYKSLKTPTAVADYVIANNQVFEENLFINFDIIKEVVSQKIIEEKEMLLDYESFLKLKIPAKLVDHKISLQRITSFLTLHIPQRLNLEKQRLDFLLNSLQPVSRTKIEQLKAGIESWEKQIKLLSPEATLARGYTISTINGKSISEKNQPTVGDELITLSSVGKLRSKIENYEQGE